MTHIITKTFTVCCRECSAAPEQKQVRQILSTESRGGSRLCVVRCCPHCTVDETFDIENQTEETTSPS